jgi:mannose-1-phosphate guanylyltransferase
MMKAALIMAGGSGQRFWPLSTPEKPKQLLNLFSDKTMIRETVDRILPIIPPENIFIATNIKQGRAIIEELPMLPEENIIIEPAFKDTAAAIGYGSYYIRHRLGDVQLVVLASDHLIKDGDNFRDIINSACDEALKHQTIVTLGIKPRHPETGYGYIEVKGEAKLEEIYEATRFCEKPDLETAKYYIKKGNFLWNSGMFIFSISTIINEIESYMPNHYKTLTQINEVISKDIWGEGLAKETTQFFEEFEKISIDFGIMEKSKRIKVIPSDFGWNDIGSFTAFEEVFPANVNGTVVRNVQLNELESRDNIIIGNGKEIATLGVEGLVIVQTKEKLLICRKDKVQDIKKLL